MINYITFHHLKHHLLSDIEWLTENKNRWDENIMRQIKTIGSSQLDYYVGKLTAQNIIQEISEYMHNINVNDIVTYSNWIGNGGFKEITISDGSLWTLRLIEKQEFIHIHPSRYSENTIRVKANALKTALCTLIFEDTETFLFNTLHINQYREKLGLSPIAKGNHSELEFILSKIKLKINT